MSVNKKVLVKRLECKAKIIAEHKLKSSEKTLNILDELWDEDGVFHQEKVAGAVEKIKSWYEKNKFFKRKLINDLKNDFKKLGLLNNEFEIAEVNSDRKTSIQVTFRLKGNKKVIEHLNSKGWEIDRRYKNDTGDPSIWSSDWHGKNFQFKFVMIALKYVLDE